MNNKSKKILSEISPGELIDKISILEIKLVKIKDEKSLSVIKKEYQSLTETKKLYINSTEELEKLINEIKEINLKLWDIEDGKRLAEKNNKFDSEFIKLARNVYKFNDERAKIKLEINKTLGSNIKEVKSYE